MAKKITKGRTTRRNTGESYYVYYVKGCSPHIKEFKTKKAMDQFVDSFDSSSEDDWIDFSFKGKMLKTYSGYKFTE